MRKTFLYIIFFLLSVNVFAEKEDSVFAEQDTLPHVDARLAIIECDSRSWLSTFGHVALHLICEEAGLDYAFSYETDYGMPLLSMLRGEPAVGLLAVPWKDYVGKYHSEGRDIDEYELNLKSDEKRKLWSLVDTYVDKGRYMNIDLLDHGCSEETVALIRASVDGTIEYDKSSLPKAHTLYDMGKMYCPAHSLMYFMMVQNTHVVDIKINDEDKVALPPILYDVLSKAVIHPNDGTRDRSLLVESSHISIKAQEHLVNTDHFRIDYLLYALLIFTIFICVAELCIGKKNRVAKIMGITCDIVLLTIYLAQALLFFLIVPICNLTYAEGWNTNMLVYNLIPVFVYAFGMVTNFGNRAWMRVYAFYTIALILFLVYMSVMRERFIVEQMVLILTFIIRCACKTFERYKRYKSNKQHKQHY